MIYHSQKQRILEKLKSKKRILLPELMRMGIACHTKCISDLRSDGFVIENTKKYNRKKRCYESFYDLVDKRKKNVIL